MTPSCLDDERAQGLASASPNREEAAHLAACPVCRELVLGYRTLALSLAALRPPAPPPGFAEGVFARLAARREAERRLALWGVLLLVPATLVALGSLWLVARAVGDGAAFVGGGAALLRALTSLARALAPLQATIGLACALLCVPLALAFHRLSKEPA